MMKDLTCREMQDVLAAFCDGELDVEWQLAVRTHLEWCDACRDECEGIRAIGHALRDTAVAPGHAAADDLPHVHNTIMARVEVERADYLARRAERLFDDMHLVWAAAGATLATAACVVALLGFVRLSLREAPYSMAAVIGAMADPGSNRNPISPRGRVLMPRANTDAMPALANGDQGVLALSAVVTREGEVRNVALLEGDALDGEMLEVLEAAAQARFEPARAGGAPVAVNVVWLLARTTVVGKGGLEVIHLTPRWENVPARRTSPAIQLPPPSVPVSSIDPATETSVAA